MRHIAKAAVTRCALCASFAAIILCSRSFASADHNPPPEIPIQQWLQGPDRRDFDWKVTIEPPILTFQQRHLQQVETTFSVSKLLKAGASLSDLHFVVKFADGDGNWFPGQCYSRFKPPPDLRAGDHIHSFASVYLRPGKYKVAVMAYDGLHRRGNLRTNRFEVPAVKHDPLPEMDRDLPQIDFLPDVQHLDIRANEPTLSDPWALGSGALRLPVDTETSVQLDLVADFTPSLGKPTQVYHWNAAIVMQISEALSQIEVSNGCVRFTAISLLGQKTYLHGEDAHRVDWDNLRRALEQTERDNQSKRALVDVRTLAAPKPAPDHYARFMDQILAGMSTCDVGQHRPRHVLVVVSDALPFFYGMEKAAVQPQSLLVAEYYYLELDRSVGGVRSDQMEGLLKSLHPTQLRFKHAIEFREALAHIISALKRTGRSAGRPRPAPCSERASAPVLRRDGESTVSMRLKPRQG
jgi:hypothetical protein